MITYIISHKESHKDRTDNLLYVLEWLNNIDTISRVIIVEQDSESKIEIKGNYNYELDHEFLYNPNNHFNKCWAYNYGAKLSNTKWIAFGDNDVIMNTDTLNFNIKESIDNYDIFSPYKDVIDLSIDETKLIKLEMISPNYNRTRLTGSPFCGGIFFIKRNIFFDVGAWDENFLNWGAEDDDLSNRTKHLKRYQHDNNSFHLHHHRNIQSTEKNQFYKKNIERYIKNLKEGIKKVDVNMIGLENKYME